eukprot:GHVT01048416.1.p1 GENE.GHVT01048416.1~~GHVT01048416.1.p1  ORF type:complete len:255 (-),score=50.78 GHVT01048416.1:198-962(-)
MASLLQAAAALGGPPRRGHSARDRQAAIIDNLPGAAPPLPLARKKNIAAASSGRSQRRSGAQPCELELLRSRPLEAFARRPKREENAVDFAQESLHFLCGAAHRYAVAQPSLSRLLLRRMGAICAHGGIEVDERLARRICGACGSLMLPGVSAAVAARPVRSKRMRHRFDRVVNDLKPTQSQWITAGGGGGRGGAQPVNVRGTEFVTSNVIRTRCGACMQAQETAGIRREVQGALSFRRREKTDRMNGGKHKRA